MKELKTASCLLKGRGHGETHVTLIQDTVIRTGWLNEFLFVCERSLKHIHTLLFKITPKLNPKNIYKTCLTKWLYKSFGNSLSPRNCLNPRWCLALNEKRSARGVTKTQRHATRCVEPSHGHDDVTFDTCTLAWGRLQRP